MRIKTLVWIGVLMLLFWVAALPEVQAQCPMCKLNVKASMATGAGGKGFGLNTGIVYLLVTPYLAFVTISYFAYRHYRKRRKLRLA